MGSLADALKFERSFTVGGVTFVARTVEIAGITADKLIELELVPKATDLTKLTVPILSGIEVIDETESSKRIDAASSQLP